MKGAKRNLRRWAVCVAAVPWLAAASAPEARTETPEVDSGSGPAVLLEVEGPVGPATDDYIGRSLEAATEAGAPVVIIRLDTPGGLDTSMRSIVRLILESPVPVAVYVAPEGARAASAGTYLLYAAHVAAMAPATNLGAATPVQFGGAPAASPPAGEGEDGDEDAAEEPAGAMERKIVNDAVAFIRGLAELRGRNAEWAEEAVRRGVSLTSSEALEENVIDLRVADLAELLEGMDGRTVEVQGQDRVLATSGLPIERREPDWRTRLLSLLSNPNIAYILMLLGIYGLILEFAEPGALVPGVTGAICLLLALFAFQLLPINYAGLALILLGIVLMVAEAFAPSFGVLGIGGGVAFVLGSVILIEPGIPGFEIHLPLIIAFAIASAVFFVFVLALAVKAWRQPVVSGRESLVGARGVALEDFETEGRVRVQSESWKARSTVPVEKDEEVEVTAIEGLLLSVAPVHETKPEEKPS
ncbi:MAG: nodulation protein NfeD [Verrucomicrobiales bacterium]